ncbi:MAG TPA: metallopeptidase TldD-related protein [Candidatus Polarisedimenticolaceae bacterium]|nr:metallopeptidase TldD-related protein [Candidatus Polarisedimenticolaceae bacterium]
MAGPASTIVTELEAQTDLAKALIARAQARGAFLIWRAQATRAARLLVRSGRVEEAVVAQGSGHGVHAVLDDGRSAFGSRDDFGPEPSAALLDATIDAASSGGALGVAGGSFAPDAPSTARDLPAGIAAFDALDLDAASARLVALERELTSDLPGVTTTLAFQAVLEVWRILRSDGADVLFAVPRCVLRASLSSSGDARHTVGASLADPSPRMFDDPAAVATFLARARAAGSLAAALPDAPTHPAGSFPLVIDYALAKGLAHEAFGHASEADGFRSSVLARDGRFRSGDTVGPAHVSVIDEPVQGDFAWQPYSATGSPRRRATIVDHGRLRDALTDAWSARGAGTALTGADRAESFRSAPLPRMSNIRIELDDPLPAPGAFEDYSAERVRDLLGDAGIFSRHRRVAFLSGYGGGQVNPPTGDFVFNCKAIYALGPDEVVLHKPAIFSGSMFGALGAVREGFGPLKLDAIGSCGKWGQSVPSSGGSHYFLVLDPDPGVRLGGR